MAEKEKIKTKEEHAEQIFGKSIAKKMYSNNDYTMNYPEGYPNIPKEEPKKIDHVDPNAY